MNSPSAFTTALHVGHRIAVAISPSYEKIITAGSLTALPHRCRAGCTLSLALQALLVIVNQVGLQAMGLAVDNIRVHANRGFSWPQARKP